MTTTFLLGIAVMASSLALCFIVLYMTFGKSNTKSH